MALIEGVGDEVTVLFAVVLLLLVLVLAWISTHTSERLPSPWLPPLTAPVDVPASNEESPGVGERVGFASRTLDPSHVEDTVCRNDAPLHPHPTQPFIPFSANSELIQSNPDALTGPDPETREPLEELSPVTAPEQSNGAPSLDTDPSNQDQCASSHLLSNQIHSSTTDPSESGGSDSPSTNPTLRDGDSSPTATPTLSNSPPNLQPTLRHRTPREGAGRDPADGTFILRLKFLNDTERRLAVQPTDTLLHVKRTYFPGQENRVRFIYQGQLLHDDSLTVSELQLRDGCVLHCHISQHASGQGPGGPEQAQVPLNVGSLLVPLLVLILVILWYYQLQYPYVFTATATACLGGVTLLVSIMAFSSYRR